MVAQRGEAERHVASSRWERWSPLASTGAIALVYVALYHLLIVTRLDEAGELAGDYYPVAGGTAAAPFQYRPLIPELTVWLAEHVSALTLRHWVTVISAGSFLLAIGLLTAWACRRYGSPAAMPLVVLYIGAWGLGAVYVVSPETLPSMAAVAAVAYGIERRTAAEKTAFLVGVILLIPMRVELVAMLGLGLLVQAWICKRQDAAAWGAACTIAGAVGYLALRFVIYPDAAYTAETPMNQISYNLATWRTALPFLLLLPLLGPLVARFREVPDSRRGGDLALVVWAALFTATALVVARPAEIRLWLPYAGVLAVIAAPEMLRAMLQGSQARGSS